MQGKQESKIGVDEFMAIAERFGFSAEAIRRIRAAVSNTDLQDGEANLARYYCPIRSGRPVRNSRPWRGISSA